MTLRPIGLIPALALASAAQQPAEVRSSSPTFKAGAEEVVLDLIVRDKKGRPVRDLEPGDIAIYDNGERVQFNGLHLVQGGGDAEIAGTRTAAANRPAMDPLRQLRLVTLVFERLGTDGRVLARQAALDIFKTRERANVYYAIFIIDQRLKLIQQYTNDRQALKRAIQRATGDAYSEFSSDSDNLAARLRGQVGAPRGGQSLTEQVADQAASSAITQGTAGSAGAGAAAANAVMAQMQLDMLQFSQELNREQAGRSSIFPLLALVKGQNSLPGRKSVIYFTEGLYVPASLSEVFQTVIGAANRNNVTFYAADIRGLQTTGDNGGIAELRGAAASSNRSTMGNRPGAVTRDQVTAQDRAAEAIRMNGQNAMAELAENTGGFLISNTNDFRIPLRKVDEELNSYYEVNYTPARVEYDGKFRRIEVRALRPGLVIQSRSGYFALPPTEGRTNALLQPFEVPLLKVLESASLPHDVEFRTRTLWIRPHGAEKIEGALVVELPLAKIRFQPDDASGIYRGQIGIVALLRNSKGEVVRKIARDLPFESPPERVETVRGGNFVFKEAFAIPPGRYTVEVAVLDRKAEKASAKKSVFMAQPSNGPLSVSSLMRVRSYAPNAPDLEALDPFQYQGGRITPALSETLHSSQDQTLGLFCVISPDPQSADKPTLTLEYVQDDKVVGRGDFVLPTPDSQGRIPWALFTPVRDLKPGAYEVRAIVRQGQLTAMQRMPLNVEP